MTFRPYEKIHRLGKDEVEGILDGTCVIQEKIDGANTSIWLDDNENINNTVLASRNQIITSPFNGFQEYIFDSPYGANIFKLLKEHPTYRLYGEWLVKHTVQYYPESYKKWYMYDIHDQVSDKYLPQYEVKYLANRYEIFQPQSFAVLQFPKEDLLKTYVGRSTLGAKGEGIVVKNEEFVNRWGNRCYAKLVHQEFLEENALVFNSNDKHSEAYFEMYIINKYLNEARLHKIIDKIRPEIDEKLDLKHIPRITNTVYHDLVTEEAWEIAKLNKNIDFKRLKTLALKKSKLLYMEYLNEPITNLC